MPAEAQKYLIEGADFREDLEPELVRLLSKIWDRKKDPLRPSWIVIPAAPLARHLKKVLLDAGVPLLNAEFLTLTTLRDRLAAEHDLPASLAREKQELLLRAMLKDAGRNPEASDILLTAIDAMRDAGHPAESAFEQEGSLFGKLAEDFEARVGKQAVQYLDRKLLEGIDTLHASRFTLHERDVVLYGFDAGDWPGAWVLLAGAKTAARSAVFIRNAGGQVESLELSWMAWWREHYGEHSLPGSRGSHFSARVPALKELEERMFVPMREARAGVNAEVPLENAENSVVFLRHRSVSSEARDASALGAAWAAELGGCVGLVFAGANPLSRMAAARLQAWGIPFEDQLGSPVTDLPENVVLRLWLSLQEEGPHGALLERLARGLGELSMDTPLRRRLADRLEDLVEALESAKAMTMSDDIRVMARSLGEGSILAQFASDWDRMGWPESATPSEMAKCVSESLGFLFGERAYELESGFAQSMAGLAEFFGDRPLARSEWVRYLGLVLDEPGRVRHGRNYSPVVVTSLERSRGQCFDAVIFCGLNEGGFPEPLKELPFCLDERSRELDAAVSKVDAVDGVRRFGRWQSPILNFTALRGLERQRFWDLVNNARAKVCFSSFVWDDLDSHAEKEPSELFDWAWWAAHGFQTSEWRVAKTRAIEEATLEWSSKVNRLLPRRESPGDLEPMISATRGRFDPARPCDEHQFVFPLSERWKKQFEGKLLAASAAERLLADPVSFWFEKILQVVPSKDAAAITAVPSRRGSLLHDLVSKALQAGGRTDAGLPKGMLYPIERAGKIRRDSLEAWMSRLESAITGWFGRLPVWWEIELAELRLTALGVLDFFSREETPDDPFAAEWKLDGPCGGIAWAAKLDHVARKGKDWTVTDLKTGGGSSAMVLKAGRLLRDGGGFQLVIYAHILAARLGLDRARIGLRYHHPRLRGGDKTIHARLQELESTLDPILAYLKGAWGEGCLGQRSDNRAGRPLSHLLVPDEILREKWNRTPQLNEWPWDATPAKGGEEEGDEETAD